MKKKLFLFFTIIFLTTFAFAQQYRPPVNLNIQNRLQETEVWCWVAVSQEIIIYLRGDSPSQLELAAIGYNIPIQVAHQNPSLCVKPGSLQQIQSLIYQFGGHPSAIASPTDPITLYNSLREGHPIILQIGSVNGMAHVIVIRGMEFVNWNGNIIPVLCVNDPMSIYIQPLRFDNLIRMWKAAIVVH